MSMRHHWQELDELLAQLDREERFKQGPFRPGLKALQGDAVNPECPDSQDEPGTAEIVPIKPD